MQSISRRALRMPSAVRYASSQASAASASSAAPPAPAAPATSAAPTATSAEPSSPFPSTSSATPTKLSSAPIQIGPTHLNRLTEHYNRTLQTSLMYMTYSARQHQEDLLSDSTTAPHLKQPSPMAQRGWDPTSPYTALRPARPTRGNRRPNPGLHKISPSNPSKDLVRLERIVINIFCKEAQGNKHLLVPIIAQLRAITGVRVLGSAADRSLNAAQPGNAGYIEVLRSKRAAISFRVRPGMPMGVKAVVPGPLALQVIDQLVTFVLPRVRGFTGFALPPPTQPSGSPAAQSGVVSLGLTPDAMSLWPGTEVNWDSYPGKATGFQIDCITNVRGPGASRQARLLMSGLGIPFVRRGDAL